MPSVSRLVARTSNHSIEGTPNRLRRWSTLMSNAGVFVEQLIYVQVLNFPGGLLQPTRALHMHDMCYRVLESSDDPEHDVWAFEEDTVVQCETKEFGDGETGLIAVTVCACSAFSRNT